MISLKNVGVSFPVYHGDRDSSLRTLLSGSLKSVSKVRAEQRVLIVEALNDITLTISPGDRLGLVVYNGSGKTTLLKAIAGVYPISAGELVCIGETRGFFNIGAGIDFSVSGYRNVKNLSYFYTRNKALIEEKIPQIIEFSELSEFIHLPVSTYSAGMIARLMVSVATSFETENLLFDEVLGAGDEKFLKKLSKRVDRMIADSKCFILATHSTGLMKQYCNRAIWLDKGSIKFEGSVEEVLREYEKLGQLN